ncbi:MAG: hypothetical protein COS99_00205 [Candidatus Omnitrophica bacterium CG07_land_8_20_14_0_80_42_15]|uniref:Recombinase family protein n=1 Tax=Candidatus Aquitaenariimonas noxiae TaxID=1974741 RepID=A0A2J0L7G2_9BACT|nr:MAG: hypothetical protein COS99_00205 [Candidatus Omnitrophica bacterium CG07_land_8_20_14_0_80_42_15]
MEDVMKKLCGIYARVSTERQAEIKDGSLDTQISRLKNYITYRNTHVKDDEKWVVSDIYREEGRSGKDTHRPELQRLLSDVASGKINTVICTKLDRITRSIIDFDNLTKTFKKYHIEFISLEENFDTTTPIGEAMLEISLVFAKLERQTTSKRTKDKMQWRAEQGLWNGGQILGYDLVDKKLIVNHKEAQTVKLMFEKYIELGSVLQVVEWLNKHGYRTKEYVSRRKGIKRGGNRFFNAYVSQKLTSRVYIGEVTHNDNMHKGQHKPIIDKKLWNEANRLLKLHAPLRKNPKRETKYIFVLQGLVKCGKCGNYMTSKYSTGRNGLHPYYQCTRNAHGGKDACDMKYVPAAEFEKAILEKIKDMCEDKKRLQEIVKKANRSTESALRSLKQDRKIQENKLKPIANSIKHILDALSKGIKNKSVSEKLSELELQKDQIEKDIQNIDFEMSRVKQQILNAKVMHESLTRFRQIYETATPLKLKELLPSFVEKITWKPTQIEIALFDQEVQRGQLENGNVTTKGGGALPLVKWLRLSDEVRSYFKGSFEIKP